MRSVYRVADVGRKLDKLPHKEHENLRSTYERMIEDRKSTRLNSSHRP